MKKTMKKVTAFVVALAVLIGGLIYPSTMVQAKSYYDSYSTVSEDMANRIYDLISKQSFSLISLQTAYDFTEHFLYRSAWKVGNNFPHGNDRWAYRISDGTYTYNVGQCAGCFAYAKFVQMAYYQGQAAPRSDRKYINSVTVDELKNLLRTDGQAGEHLRMESSNSRLTPHSLLYLASDDNGFYSLSYEGGPIRLVYFTWENFVAKYGRYQVCLLNIDKQVNDLSVSEGNAETRGELSITNVKTPATLKVGKSWTCTGVITSNSPIQSVTGAIRDVDGNVVYSYTEFPYTTTYKMAGSKIDRNLLFNKLSAGVYYYTIMADTKTNTSVYISDPINVGSISKPSITNAYAPDRLQAGKSWTCSGIVKSSTNLRRVTGEILDANGNVVYSHTKNTSAKTYWMSNSVIDGKLYFNKLPVGTYYYRISATNNAGTTTWTSNAITIY